MREQSCTEDLRPQGTEIYSLVKDNVSILLHSYLTAATTQVREQKTTELLWEA